MREMGKGQRIAVVIVFEGRATLVTAFDLGQSGSRAYEQPKIP